MKLSEWAERLKIESLGRHAGRKHSDSETTGEMVDLQIRKIKKKPRKDGPLKRKKMNRMPKVREV